MKPLCPMELRGAKSKKLGSAKQRIDEHKLIPLEHILAANKLFRGRNPNGCIYKRVHKHMRRHVGALARSCENCCRDSKELLKCKTTSGT